MPYKRVLLILAIDNSNISTRLNIIMVNEQIEIGHYKSLPHNIHYTLLIVQPYLIARETTELRVIYPNYRTSKFHMLYPGTTARLFSHCH